MAGEACGVICILRHKMGGGGPLIFMTKHDKLRVGCFWSMMSPFLATWNVAHLAIYIITVTIDDRMAAAAYINILLKLIGDVTHKGMSR